MPPSAHIKASDTLNLPCKTVNIIGVMAGLEHRDNCRSCLNFSPSWITFFLTEKALAGKEFSPSNSENPAELSRAEQIAYRNSFIGDHWKFM